MAGRQASRQAGRQASGQAGKQLKKQKSVPAVSRKAERHHQQQQSLPQKRHGGSEESIQRTLAASYSSIASEACSSKASFMSLGHSCHICVRCFDTLAREVLAARADAAAVTSLFTQNKQ